MTADEAWSREQTVPRLRLSKPLSLNKLKSPATINKAKKTMTTTYLCPSDLASRLDLLSDQENKSLAEYDDDVPIDHIVCREKCCCGQISRYGLVFLVSRHHQDITIGMKFPEAIPSIIIETSLGRFTCYTHEDRNLVHFEDSVCSSNIPLIPNQNMDEILLAARGYYLINDTPQSKKFAWRQCPDDSLEFLASGNFFGIPDAVIYMPQIILERWKRLKKFSWALYDAMNAVLKDLHEPVSYVIAMQHFPEDYGSSIKRGIPMNTTAERLAACVYLCRTLSKKKLLDMDFDSKFLFFTKYIYIL